MDARGSMSVTAREALEASVKALCDARDYDGAATLTIKGYGPEVHGFLVALHKSEDEAGEVFSTVTENLWRALPSLAWAPTLRTWVYTIARHASLRWRKVARRHARGAVPITSEASRLAAEVRTQTQTFLKTDRRDALARLRDELAPEDRTLLVLRVDRDLAWNELALVMLGEDGARDEAALKREAARLRKRSQLVKDKLVAMGRRDGLLPDPGDR